MATGFYMKHRMNCMSGQPISTILSNSVRMGLRIDRHAEAFSGLLINNDTDPWFWF